MSVLDVLPPSPPDTSHRDRMPLPQLWKPNTSTPDDSPASLIPSSSGARKRVEFSPWTNARNPPSSEPVLDTNALKSLPRSRDCQPVNKSILKPYVESDVLMVGLDGADDLPIPVTMDSIVQQLSQNDKISSVDAYQSLAQLIRTYDEIPDDSDTRSNVVNVLRCIKRDLSAQDQALSTPVDINLATQAIKVSVIFVWSEHLSPLLTDDFRIFIVDRAIKVLTEHMAPKCVIILYMHLLATQNFRSAMFTSGNRTVKLLEALREITTHVQGKGAISERLLVYQKLIDQAKPVMKARASLWIREVFMGLSSKVRDIQEKSISVCSRSCTAFPQSSQIAQAARQALGEPVKDKTLHTVLTHRLINMLTTKEEASQVPQIWALVMLQSNSLDARIESWSPTKDWLVVLQKCFNSSNSHVRAQAFSAWNRLIYITRPHEASDNMLAMLSKPIMAKLEAVGTGAPSKGTRPAAVSSYCTLLYYAFRPAATHKQYVRVWNEYIVKIATSRFLSQSTANADLSCRILMALFWKDSSATRIWNENRAHENRLTEPEELPTIDCKWVRLQATAILEIFRLLFRYSSWGPVVQHSDQAFVAKAWRHFLKSIRESASKEIKPSNDTRKALSSIIDFLLECPLKPTNERHIPSSQTGDLEARTRVACNIAIAELGASTVIDEIQSKGQQPPTAILEELLVHSLSLLHRETDNSDAASMHMETTAVRKSLPAVLPRVLECLNTKLREAYLCGIDDVQNLTTILNLTTKCLRNIPSYAAVQCLTILEGGLSSVIEDRHEMCRTGSADTALTRAWEDLLTALISSIMDVSIAQYADLDALLAAVLSSSNDSATSRILDAWSQMYQYDGQGAYGPKTTAAVQQIQSRVEVNLPGMSVASDDDRCDGLQHEDVDSVALTACLTDLVHNTDHESTPAIEAETAMTSVAMKQISTLPSIKDFRSGRSTEQYVKSKPKHLDSQIHFVSIDSSPPNVNEVDSQYLTERQKEVRDRQRTGQDVAFADLRSSPQNRESRPQRVTPDDCEMARKVAALDNMPTTPTLPRQTDNMEDEVMPSPTPKARNQTLRVADIDIPSSPLSAGMENIDELTQDYFSTLAKTLNANEQDGDATHDGILGGDLVGSEYVVTPLNFAAVAKALEPNLVQDQLADSELPTKRGDTDACQGVKLVEDATYDICMEKNEDEAREGIGSSDELEGRSYHKQATGDARDKSDLAATFPDSDEIDEASASQLSQDLNQHLNCESRALIYTTTDDVTVKTQLRKRKRVVNGYADGDGKHRRKRTSLRKAASQSQSSDVSQSSDTSSRVISEEDVDTEDCIVVSTTPRPLAPACTGTAASPELGSAFGPLSAPSTERRRRNRLRKATRNSSNTSLENLRSKLEDAYDASKQRSQGSARSTPEFHTPTPSRVHVETTSAPVEPDNLLGITHGKETERTEANAAHVPPASTDPQISVMTALQLALDGLRTSKEEIDLRMIDELCFKIRFQAQEMAQRRCQ